MLYKLRIDIAEDDGGGKHIVYGVDCYCCVRSVPDVFTDKEKTRTLVELLNVFQPDPIHLDDIIQDFMAK